MKRNLGSVFVNDAQSNPLQPDVQYRGFVGSPLLGLPQGLAVYQDGVRINEPFGDTVNWALIPESRDRHGVPDARLESAVRAERARRRDLDQHQERLRQPGHARRGARGLVGPRRRPGGNRRLRRRHLQLLRHGVVSRRGRLARLLADGREAGVREARHEERRAVARRELHVRRHGSRRQRRRSRRASRDRPRSDLHASGPHAEPPVHGRCARHAKSVGHRLAAPATSTCATAT